MEDHFDKILYLIVGVIYLFLNNTKGRHTEKQTGTSKDYEPQPAPTAHTNRPATRNRGVQETLIVKKTSPKDAVAKNVLLSESDVTTHLAVQKPHGKRIDRRLRQYGSWKKAIIMGELLRPHS